MFLPTDSLHFDLADLIERSVADWHITKPASVPFPEMESAGDFIVSEMDRCSLRRFDGTIAFFEGEAAADEYRKCIIAALELWLAEIQRESTPEEKLAYSRDWG